MAHRLVLFNTLLNRAAASTLVSRKPCIGHLKPSAICKVVSRTQVNPAAPHARLRPCSIRLGYDFIDNRVAIANRLTQLNLPPKFDPLGALEKQGFHGRLPMALETFRRTTLPARQLSRAIPTVGYRHIDARLPILPRLQICKNSTGTTYIEVPGRWGPHPRPRS